MTHKNAPPPLTLAEEEIQYLEENEVSNKIISSGKVYIYCTEHFYVALDYKY